MPKRPNPGPASTAQGLGLEVDFRVRKEDWSKYEILDGGAVVWVRVVLLKLYELDQRALPQGAVTPAGIYTGQTTNLITAFFKPEYRKTPNPKPLTAEELAAPGDEMRLSMIEEPFNEYIIQGPVQKIIRTKAVATAIRLRKDKATPAGDPIIQVDSQVVVSQAREARPEEMGT